MRISLCNEVIGELPFPRQCELAAALGYDGLEIAPFTLGGEPHLLVAGRRAELRRAATEAGVPITSLHSLLFTPKGLSITTADAALRNRTIDVMKRLIALAVDLGAGVLVHGSPMARTLDPGNEADGRKRGIDAFGAIADVAREANVVYCIEPLSRDQTPFINTVEEAAAIVTAIANPSVRTMIDCSSAGLGEDTGVPDLVRRFVPKGVIGHIHFNDPNRRGPGEGDMKFEPILAALREAGYAGDSAVEPFIFKPDGPTCAARQIGYLRGIQETLPT